MARIKQNFRRATRKATQYPAVVVDTHGGRASARLSGNGAIVHNIPVVGGNVSVGETVSVDYTTPEPHVVALSKSWATMDDLLRLLAKYQVPIPVEPITEFDKVMLFSKDDASQYRTFPATRAGIEAAVGHAYTTDDDELDGNGFKEWFLRLPPVDIVPPGWGYDISFYRPIHVFSEGVEGAILEGYVSAYGGETFENIHFYWDAEQSKGQYPVYNMFLDIDHDEYFTMSYGLIPTSGSPFDTRFLNCKFTSFGYDWIPGGTPEPADPPDYGGYMNVYLSVDNNLSSGYIPKLIFENCDFYAQVSDNVSWDSGYAVMEDWRYFDGDGPIDIYFNNCRVDCGPKPLGMNVGEEYSGDGQKIRNVYTNNTRWIGVADLDNIQWLTSPVETQAPANFIYGVNMDLSPINHTHTSGSSGGYDDDAVHTDEAGEF